ncbi:TPA: hypothetical protein ACJ3EQ_001955 [Neisseria meningitidis]|uniref:hypothetical protein n=1 Tax=Neisseria meningitidis TaxID=487 RepID=UPI0004D7D677|nr:hypothetical protein [Neisseria meningitidis]KER39932.1 hypothetical protein F528_1123 [Neisseria meningitidis 992008]MDM1030790.1 hypothetical protein [Neisseria meningitidis]CWN65353.1 Uncharacterised protein [Neisseria meningitidis]CWR60282.1 Uncharacterised protein [Neisseria meningitidis]
MPPHIMHSTSDRRQTRENHFPPSFHAAAFKHAKIEQSANKAAKICHNSHAHSPRNVFQKKKPTYKRIIL